MFVGKYGVKDDVYVCYHNSERYQRPVCIILYRNGCKPLIASSEDVLGKIDLCFNLSEPASEIAFHNFGETFELEFKHVGSPFFRYKLYRYLEDVLDKWYERPVEIQL